MEGGPVVKGIGQLINAFMSLLACFTSRKASSGGILLAVRTPAMAAPNTRAGLSASGAVQYKSSVVPLSLTEDVVPRRPSLEVLTMT